jgi:starch synthase
MNIAFIASEAVPYAKVGGLADVVGSLPQTLAQMGHSVTVFLPWYKSIWAPTVGEVGYTFRGQRLSAGLGELRQGKVRYVFVGVGEFYRDQTYGYGDDTFRFVKFAFAAAELLGGFDIVHAHDWQAAILPLLRNLGWFRGRTVYTIHNLAYQGVWGSRDFFDWTRLPGELYYSGALEHYGSVNLMKSAIANADFVTTVSPTYAQEILSPWFGEGLQGVLLEHSHKLRGILNGLDTEYWNPQTDPYLAAGYSLDRYQGKRSCREALHTELGLAPERLTLGLVSRFTGQKGIDLILDALPWLVERLNLAILGSGDPGLEGAFHGAVQAFPGRVAYRSGFNEALAHRIYAGSDGFLMPSRFEPCGLTQMIAMRYGTPPIVRATGGLRDTVFHGKTGFLFDYPDAQGLRYGVDEFLRHPDLQSVAQAGMAENFSWEAPAVEYSNLYRSLVG